MSRTTLQRLGFALVTAAVLSSTAPAAWALGARAAKAHNATKASARPGSGMVQGAWNRLVSLWGELSSAIDPNGNPVTPEGCTSVPPVPRNDR